MEQTASQKNKSRNITQDTLIGDLVQQFPEAIEPLLAEGVHCIGCGASYFETVEQGLMGHGRSSEEVDVVINKLNKAVEQAQEEASHDGQSAQQGNNSLTITTNFLTITGKAAEKVKGLISKEGDGVLGIRIAVIPGGCAGFEYEFSFEKQKQKDDIVIEEDGVKFFVDAASMGMLKGAKIDYIENLQASGFKITNPNAKASCGCGHSFG